MAKKKESWVKENWEILISIILLIYVAWVLAPPITTKSIYSKNPDKCVCEDDYNNNLREDEKECIEQIEIFEKNDTICRYDRLTLKNICDNVSIYKFICIQNEQGSIKSLLKTECEKGNPDWVEETKISDVDTSIIPHLECKLETGWFCPAIGIVHLPCDNVTGRCYLNFGYANNEMGLAYVGCEYRINVCISNTTTCKRKEDE